MWSTVCSRSISYRQVPEQLKPRRIEIGARRRGEGCETGEPAKADRHRRPKGGLTLRRLLRSASRSGREALIAENGDDPKRHPFAIKLTLVVRACLPDGDLYPPKSRHQRI